MGSVSTALSEEALSKYIRKSIYQAMPSEIGQFGSSENEDEVKCAICQVSPTYFKQYSVYIDMPDALYLNSLFGFFFSFLSKNLHLTLSLRYFSDAMILEVRLIVY